MCEYEDKQCGSMKINNVGVLIRIVQDVRHEFIITCFKPSRNH